MQQAHEQIAALARALGPTIASASIESGSVTDGILRQARKLGCDLIAIGAREHHGLALLLHRTEDSVLHGAPCDVLVVRVR